MSEQSTAVTRTEPGGMELAPKEQPILPAISSAAEAVAAREKAAVEARFIVALQRPRDAERARLRILESCRRPRFAESVRYAKPIGGKKVFGLSIRFAEEAARQWGNLYIRADVVHEDRERRSYRVTATDLETNATQEQDLVVEKFVERKNPKPGDEVVSSRLNTQGEKVYLKVASEDEVLVKAHALLSKVKRNLILSMIPADILEEAQEVALNTMKERDQKDPKAEQRRILDAFYELGVMPAQVSGLIGKPLEQFTPADLDVLRQAYVAVRDGEMTWADVEADESLAKLRKAQKPEKAAKGTEALRQAVGAESPSSPEEPPPPDAPEGEDYQVEEEEPDAPKAAKRGGKR